MAPRPRRLGTAAPTLVAILLSAALLRPTSAAPGGEEESIGGGGGGGGGAAAARSGGSEARRLTTGLPANLALFQDVLLSATATHSAEGLSQTGSGTYMVDGSTDTHYFIGSGCAETTAMPDAWARIDFGREVPIALVKFWTRSDSKVPGLEPVELYVGNIQETWRDNLLCNKEVTLDRKEQPAVAGCLATGQYLWIVLRTQGAHVSPLSLCEVEVTARGPAGTLHSLQTAGQMFDLELEGIALHKHDRIRIVDNTILCGDRYASRMDPAVLDITSPVGERAFGSWSKERWDYVQIDKMGVYKVCWCAGDKECNLGLHFNMHVATIVVNGVMMSAAGNGTKANTTDLVLTGLPGLETPLNEPYGLAVTGNRLFISERLGHRVRRMDLNSGTMHLFVGYWDNRFGLDGERAIDTHLSFPMGLGLSPDGWVLYIADSGSNRIRMVRIDGNAPENNNVTTIAGSGFAGFSGDGDLAVHAQLSMPSCVSEDLNNMLWICDTGNNRIRVVSLVIKVQIPGTNQFANQIILTAAGDGQDGRLGSPGDGNMAEFAQVGMPLALCVSDEYVDPDMGRLPTSVYITEGHNHVVRSLQLHFQDFRSVITTVAGTRILGTDPVIEGEPQAATQTTKLNSPSGIVSDVVTGNVYVSDTANNRILMMPTLEYVSLGCWRENVEAPLIPSIEGQVGDPYLDGVPEGRQDAINKCALATLRRGYLVFAVRLMGTCATFEDAYLVYKNEGSSTSCSNGLGGAKDNSVYRFARPGVMNEQLGLLYMMAGRGGVDGFSGDAGSAWLAELSRPVGLGISPATRDLWIADSGNERLRMVLSQVGPNKDHRVFCSNGLECKVTLFGNGLQPGDRLGVMPYWQQCGAVELASFQSGLEMNPVAEEPSPSFTKKSFSFGKLNMLETGAFRLCFCITGAFVYGRVTDCTDPGSYIKDAGTLLITGPDNNMASPITVVAGLRFDVTLMGMELSNFDRIRLRSSRENCGATTTSKVMDASMVDHARTYGNLNTSLWTDIRIDTRGTYTVCWCKGAGDNDEKLPCNSNWDFVLTVVSVQVLGPTWKEVDVVLGASQDVIITGSGLSAGDRIRIVDASVACGTPLAANFSMAIYPGLGGVVPYGPADVISVDAATWRGVKFRHTRDLNVCWCGARDGCANGHDFNIHAQTLHVNGVFTHPLQKFNVTNLEFFDARMNGRGLLGKERIRIVEAFTDCGSLYANVFSAQIPETVVPVGDPFQSTPNFIQWDDLVARKEALYRICLCTCINAACCKEGADFYVEAAAFWAGPALRWEKAVDELGKYFGQEQEEPLFPRQTKELVPHPAYWGEVPKNLPCTITIHVKTRDAPDHAGTVGPIALHIYTAALEAFPDGIHLTDLETGGLQKFTIETILDEALTPYTIELASYTFDAWFCEYVEVDIEWRTAENSSKIERLGSNRFPCNSWAMFPASRVDRPPRQYTDGSGELPGEVKILPEPQVAPWERRFFSLNPCGGCHKGYRCEEEVQPKSDGMKLELAFADLTARPYRAVCKPVCGDGYTVPGEQCDDGNVRSFDGCSGKCMVEHGFACMNFGNMTSRCWPQLCERVDTALQLTYWDEGFREARSKGYLLRANYTLYRPNITLPSDKAFVCYPWKYKATCPLDADGTYFSSKYEDVMRYQFSRNVSAKVDKAAYNTSYVGAGLACKDPGGFFPPLGRDGYRSYGECEEQCQLDKDCMSLTFHITMEEGGAECPADYTPQRCGARCRLLASECDNATLLEDKYKITPTHDAYHVGRKHALDEEQLGGEWICSKLELPRPVNARESNGVITVLFDGPVEGFSGEPDALGFLNSEAFDCLDLLSETSYVAVGGTGSSCRAVLVDTLEIYMGPLATVRRPDGFDHQRQTYGDPAVLLFDSHKLRPMGVTMDFWALDPPEQFRVFIHTTRPLAVRDGGKPVFPDVIIRGPTQLGGCGALELTADTSSMSGSRRWRSAEWICTETRVLNDTFAPLTREEAEEAINACAPGGRIHKLLQERPWCGIENDNTIPGGVLRPCELRVVIPSEAWCGISHIWFKVALTTTSGVTKEAEWDTEIMIRSRIPTAAAIGPNEVFVPPQRDPGAPLPRLRLEVSTEPDFEMMNLCTCGLTLPPATDGSEAEVTVRWYYGEIRYGVKPMFYDMFAVPQSQDESDATNVLTLALRGDILLPESKWLFVARAAYAVHDQNEATLVPFLVHVGPLLPPKIVLKAPSRVNQDMCNFVIDASQTQLRDFLLLSSRAAPAAPAGGADDEEEEEEGGGSRLLQVVNISSMSLSNSTVTFTTTVGYDSVKPQSLAFQWDVYRLLDKLDDRKGIHTATAAMKSFRQQSTPYVTVDQRALDPGLYIFTVRAIDTAFPDIVGEENVTVEVDEQERPTYLTEGPAPILGPFDDTTVSFTQYGFSSCPIPFDLPGQPPGRMLLMRGVEGEQPDEFEAVAELDLVSSFNPVGSYLRALTLQATVDRALLRPGFVYRYKLFTTSIAHGQMDTYIEELFDAARRQVGGDPASRAYKREPLIIPDWVWVDDSLPFTVVAGPTAGSLEVLEPLPGVGYSMQENFKFQQLWATEAPPLQYAYFYARVSDAKLDIFEEYRLMGFTDANTTARLSSLVEGEWIVMSDWSEDPTLVTPLPTGLYVIGSKVRDANAMEDMRLAAVRVLSPWTDDILTAQDRINQLTEYVTRSQQVILQVRGANRGAAAVVPIAAAVKELPDLTQYDFATMLNWYPTSGLPNPMWSQPIYGTPILSKELRELVVGFLSEVMNVISDIVGTLDKQAILGFPDVQRRLQIEFGRMSTVQAISTRTPSHVQALAEAFVRIAESIAPVRAPELGVKLGHLVIRLLSRTRLAGFDIRTQKQAARNLLRVEGVLLANTEPAPTPRDGDIKVNTSESLQVKLSKVILSGIQEIGDALSAFLPTDVEERVKAQVVPVDNKHVMAGDLTLTVLVRSLDSVKAMGVNMMPDYQAKDRWAYPRIELAGLGEPGFMGQNWAATDTKLESTARYQSALCYQPPEQESIFDRITVLMVEWPSNPVMYASGSLIGSKANVTMGYTVELRSCGETIDIGASGAPGKLKLTFRLEPDIVRDRRWGYQSLIPYRVSWWEDIPGIGTSEDRIRRWTTLGCLTAWQNSQEDVVKASCDRMPSPGSGSVFAIELVPRPPFTMEPPPAQNSHFHNVASYFFCLMILRGWYLLLTAYRRDVQFWLSEQDLIKIIFIPAEFRWNEKVRRGNLKPKRPEVPWLSKEGMKRLQENIIAVLMFVVACVKTIAGAELFSRFEVRELICMRSGRRDAVYQHFVEAMDDKEHAQKIAIHTFQQVQKQMAMQALAPPKPPPRRPAWPDAVQLADAFPPPALEPPQPPAEAPPTSAPVNVAAAELTAQLQAEQVEVLRDAVKDIVVPPHEQEQPVSNVQGGVGAEGFEGQGAVVLQGAEMAEMVAYEEGRYMRDYAGASGVGGLPPGWEEYTAEEYGGKVYYCYVETGETTWDRPIQMEDGSVQFQAMDTDILTPQYRESPRAAGQVKRRHKLGTLRESAQGIRDPRDGSAPSRASHTLLRDSLHMAPPPPPPEPLEVHGAVQQKRRTLRKTAIHAAPPPDGVEDQESDADVQEKPRTWRKSVMKAATPPGSPQDKESTHDQPHVLQGASSHEAAPPANLVDEGPAECVPVQDTLREAAAEASTPAEHPDNQDTVDYVQERPGPSLRTEAVHAALDPDREKHDSEAIVREQVHRALEAADDSPEVVLPSGWDMHTTADGRDFYVNLRAGLTQWDMPKLPPHWEERVARDGKVYYLSLFDGRTQWEWPSESPEARLMLALPGATEASLVPRAIDDRSETTVDTAVGAADQLDADALLAMPPGKAATSSEPTGTPRTGEPPADEAWAICQRTKDWQDIKKKLKIQKEAHDNRFATAKSVPGVREFVRPHEMAEIVGNWDRQLDNATLQVDLQQRERRALGHRAELRKEDLKVVFPVIQRLQWTKWDALEIFVYSLMHAMPSQTIFLNYHRPTKRQRCHLHLFYLSVLFLASCMMLSFAAPVDEEVTALDRSTWNLLADFFTMPFQAESLGVMLVAGLTSAFVRKLVLWAFFACHVSGDRPPLDSIEARREQLKFWHELSEMGRWVCVGGAIICLGVSLTLCAAMPQPRSVGVVRVFLIVCLWSHLVYPLIKAAMRTFILCSARSGPAFDGLLNVYPGLMDFAHVGVQTPEFLSWRTQKIVAEEDLLRRVFEVADGKGAGADIDELVKEELEFEADAYRQNFQYQGAQMQLEDRATSYSMR